MSLEGRKGCQESRLNNRRGAWNEGCGEPRSVRTGGDQSHQLQASSFWKCLRGGLSPGLWGSTFSSRFIPHSEFSRAHSGFWVPCSLFCVPRCLPWCGQAGMVHDFSTPSSLPGQQPATGEVQPCSAPTPFTLHGPWREGELQAGRSSGTVRAPGATVQFVPHTRGTWPRGEWG